MALTDAQAARRATLIAERDSKISGNKVRRITHGQRTKEMADGDIALLQAEIDRLDALERNGSTSRRGSIVVRFK
jgi:hypothetical protein